MSLCRRDSLRVPFAVSTWQSGRPRAVRRSAFCIGEGTRSPPWRMPWTIINLPISASAMRAAARVIASVWGDSTSFPPVTSTTPITLPVSGSWIGADAHDHFLFSMTKCSDALICTAESRRSAVPGALVPTDVSSHCEPSTNRMLSALRTVSRSPHTHSRTPSASPMAMTLSHASAALPSTSKSRGNTVDRACCSRCSSSSVRSNRNGTSVASALTPAAADRSHESMTRFLM